MKRFLLSVTVAVGLSSGCGDSQRAVPPAGPMTPPGAGAEQEGGGGAKGKAKKVNANTADEK